MQKIEGDGMAFVHSGGTLAKKVLRAGEVLKVDTGCIVGFTKDVDYDIEFIGGIKNSVFGGEGLFYATLTRSRHRLRTIITVSVDWLIESLPQHQEQVEKAVAKVASLAD